MNNIVSHPTRAEHIGRRYERAERGEAIPLKNAEEVVAFCADAIHRSGRTYKSLAADAHVCVTTVSRLANMETQSPQIRTAISVLAVLDYELTVRR